MLFRPLRLFCASLVLLSLITPAGAAEPTPAGPSPAPTAAATSTPSPTAPTATQGTPATPTGSATDTPTAAGPSPTITATPTEALTATATAAPDSTASATAPPTATAAGMPAVRLNEFLAAPTAGQTEFIELYNPGPAPAAIGGWQVDDVVGGSAPRTVPAGTLVPPGGFWVITFANVLNNGGDDVRLLDPTGALIDSYHYGAAQPDRSASRLPDGAGEWIDGTPPTPNAANQVPPAPTASPIPTTTLTPEPTLVMLNEYLAAPASGEREFVEVVNLGAGSVDLRGWRVRDLAGHTRTFTLAALLPGEHHALRMASGFLNNSDETLALADPQGLVRDQTDYAAAASGLSTSRLPDGSGAWTAGTPPTPDQPNQASPPPAIFTVRINEFLAAPISGTEFIEIYNLGPDPAILGGWQIDDDIGGGAPKTIPAGTLVPVGGFWTLRINGAYLNNAADAVRLIDPSGAIVDQSAYTSAVAGLSRSRLPDGDGEWVDGTPPTPDAANQAPPPPPPAARFRLTLNEFLAVPISGTEFIELYNAGPDPAVLVGWQIDDEPGGGTPKTIPGGTVIPAGGFWALSSSGLLNNDGDAVRLIDPSGTITDEIAYAGATAGLSTSRLPDGGGEWVGGTPPTPNAANQAPPPPAIFTVRINEVLATPFSGGSEFVEIYNLGPDPAEIGGWQIDDGAGVGGAPKTIPAGTVIAPGGWWALSWRGALLNAADDEARLVDPSGVERDRYAYGASLAGLSASRLPDGSGDWADGTPPTPDAANQAPAATPDGIVINEVMPHPPSGQPEWIELYSAYTATVDLAGWRLDDAVGGAKPALIPAGTTIGPGAWLRIELPGSMLNDGGDWARLLAPDGSVVDAMAYGKTKKPTSWSRLPDGLGQWYHDTPPTPGEPNAPPPEPPATSGGEGESAGTTAPPGSLLLTEVVYDVPGDRDENANEWIEMTNVTSATIQLEGWSVNDNKTATRLPAFAIEPGEVVVLATTAELLHAFPAFSATLVLVGGSRLGNGLGNNGDQLALVDGAGAVIDGLSWGNNLAIFDPAAPDAPTGHSLQRQPGDRDTDSAADWIDSPTPSPGELGSAAPPAEAAPDPAAMPDGPPTLAQPGAILITQVMYDPLAPIQEPGGEWIELLNTTPTTLTLRGWTISDGRSSDPLPTITLGPGEIGLIAASAGISETYDLSGPWVFLSDRSIGGGLNNGGDSLVLRDGAATTIDALCWGEFSDIFAPAAPDPPEGSSLLREPADRDSDSAADWTAQADAQPTGATRRDQPEWRLPDDSTVILSEALAAPKAEDWNDDGAQNGGDEWIELVNLSAAPVELAGWSLDDIADGGSRPFTFPDGTVIAGDGYLVVFASASGLALNNSGREQVRLLRPDGRLADILEYRSTKPDQAWARIPSPAGRWVAEAPPTPNAANRGAAGGEGRTWGDPLPIGRLRSLPLTATVALSGVVTVRPDILRKQAFYLQDSSGGVMVLLKSGGEWPSLAPGQRVSVRGKLSTFHGELQVKVDSAADLVPGLLAPPPAPLAIKGAAITDQLVGTLVQIRGTYLKADGRDMLIRAADGTTVRLHPPSGMRKPRYRKGAPVQAVGIVGRYDDKLRVQLRGLPDLGRVGGLPDTGAPGAGVPPGWAWLVPLLLAAGIAMRRRSQA